MSRLLVRFAKLGPLRFISHLDTVELFKRAIRRADLPVAYSRGNTPQMRISILHPLPLGCESESEYLNVELAQTVPAEEFQERLGRELPEGIEVRSARSVYRKLSYPYFDFLYRIEAEKGEFPSAERIAEVLARPSLPIVRRRKGKERTDDVRPYLRDLVREGDHLYLRVAWIDGRTVRPEEVMEIVTGREGTYRIRKLETTYADR